MSKFDIGLSDVTKRRDLIFGGTQSFQPLAVLLRFLQFVAEFRHLAGIFRRHVGLLAEIVRQIEQTLADKSRRFVRIPAADDFQIRNVFSVAHAHCKLCVAGLQHHGIALMRFRFHVQHGEKTDAVLRRIGGQFL